MIHQKLLVLVVGAVQPSNGLGSNVGYTTAQGGHHILWYYIGTMLNVTVSYTVIYSNII